MARAPFQVLVYPYYTAPDREFEYLILKRSDAPYWQGIAGGGEGSETPLEAARRETLEETGIPKDSRFLQLITVLPIPATEFRDSHLWGRNMCMIPQYSFGVLTKEKDIVLSSEHVEYRWLKYEEAYRLMKYEGNKIALWELDEIEKREDRLISPLCGGSTPILGFKNEASAQLTTKKRGVRGRNRHPTRK